MGVPDDGASLETGGLAGARRVSLWYTGTEKVITDSALGDPDGRIHPSITFAERLNAAGRLQRHDDPIGG